MLENDLVNIRGGIDEVNLIIDRFLLNINKGIINDLSGLDDKVEQLCSKVSRIPAATFEELRHDFETTLSKVDELRAFLAEGLESTGGNFKQWDSPISPSKLHNAANDNI